MPFLMIYGGELPVKMKAAMAKDMTRSLAEHYQVPDSMVSVFFVPLGPEDAFQAGNPVDDRPNPEGVRDDS